jgi:hypothetical protein
MYRETRSKGCYAAISAGDWKRSGYETFGLPRADRYHSETPALRRTILSIGSAKPYLPRVRQAVYGILDGQSAKQIEDSTTVNVDVHITNNLSTTSP